MKHDATDESSMGNQPENTRETEAAQRRKNLMEIHFSVFLFGLSSLFAKFISMPAPVIAWGRVIFSSLTLFAVHRALGIDIRLEKRSHYWAMAAVGIILAIHWTTFFWSAQVSTVAIATLTFSTFPVFVTFLEPYLYKDKLLLSDAAAAFVMLLGVLFIVPQFQLGNSMTQGVVLGMICSLTYAVMSLANRGLAKKYRGTVVSFYEQFAAAVFMLPLLFVYRPDFSVKDLILLLVLGIAFTALPHSLFTNGMKTIKAQTAGIISGLESVYGIIFAAVLLGEIPGFREIIGGIIILSVVFYSTKNANRGRTYYEN